MRLALRRRKAGQLPLAADDVRATWQVASLLLGYPDDTLVGQLPLLHEVTARLPVRTGAPLSRLVGALRAAAEEPAALEAVRREFVETFDYTRRCAPYLTYFAYGDTRRRGMALVTFTQAYRRSGFEMADASAELPDHLAVVLEFGATCDLPTALALVLDHRAGLEVLRLALADRGSRWADALVAVCATLPPLDGDESEAIARLIAEGPPSEDVGLAPYEIDPRLNPSPADDLPWSAHGDGDRAEVREGDPTARGGWGNARGAWMGLAGGRRPDGCDERVPPPTDASSSRIPLPSPSAVVSPADAPDTHPSEGVRP